MNDRLKKGFEIGFFKRKGEVREEQMLEVNKDMDRYFMSEQKELLNHFLIKIQDNLYADVAIANTKKDAEEICAKWTSNKFALSFLDKVEVIKFDGLEMLTFADVIGGKLPSAAQNTNDTFEIVSFEFEDEVSLEEQKRLMNELNEIVKKVDGFKSRDYYYSAETSRWIDSISWTDLNLAKKGAEEVMKNPKAQETFSKIEKKTILFSHYARIGGS